MKEQDSRGLPVETAPSDLEHMKEAVAVAEQTAFPGMEDALSGAPRAEEEMPAGESQPEAEEEYSFSEVDLFHFLDLGNDGESVEDGAPSVPDAAGAAEKAGENPPERRARRRKGLFGRKKKAESAAQKPQTHDHDHDHDDDHDDDDHGHETCGCGHDHGHDHDDHGHETCGCGHDHDDHGHKACGCGHDHGHDHDDHGHETCGCGHDHDDHDHGHGCVTCGCGHVHADPKSPEGRKKLIRLAVGAVMLAAGILVGAEGFWRPALCFASWLVCGFDVLRETTHNIKNKRFFDENLLMTVATIGAFAVGEYPEGAAVMLLFGIGELVEAAAVGRSDRSIRALLDLRPDTANKVRGLEVVACAPEELVPGDMILVRPGERVPVDGVIAEGESALDLSALTGEAVPETVGPGDTALSGAVNRTGALMIRVSVAFHDSTLSRMLRLTKEAAEKKAPAEKFITAFARVYTPVVCLLALLIALIPPIFLGNLSEWLHRGLVFLVVSCPCSLVISTPLVYFATIGGASARGILVKGGAVFERLARLHTVAFDKTGTLTEGVFKVTKVSADGGYTGEELLKIAAGAEAASTHPIARSIRQAAGMEEHIRPKGDYKELPGLGIRWEPQPGGPVVLAGNAALLARNDVRFPSAEGGGTVIYVAADRDYIGCITISDPIREHTPAALAALKNAGVARTVLLTGDRLPAAAAVASAIEIDEVHAGLLPAEKLEKMEALREALPEKSYCAFVGDGVNDAPVIAQSDVGVAMGGIGSDAAIEAADVVIMTDDLMKVSEAVGFARRASRLVRQNVIFSLGIKLVVMALGAMGIAPMWLAVFADVGVTLIAVANSLRALRPLS